MINSTYVPGKWSEIDSGKVAPFVFGITQTVPASQTTNINYILTDDVIIRGIEFLAKGSNFGDTISLKIIDTNGVTGVSPGTIIAVIVSNYILSSDLQKFLSYESVVPKKILATMTIQISYTSTGILTPINTAINFLLLKTLV